MLRISRKSEYGIIAVKYLHTQSSRLCTAGEISKAFTIPAERMAKILQSLANAGILRSTKGAYGGYALACEPKEITLGDIVEILDGPIGIVECAAEENCNCTQYQLGVCNIYGAFIGIQKRFLQFLKGITLADLNESEEQHNSSSTVHRS